MTTCHGKVHATSHHPTLTCFCVGQDEEGVEVLPEMLAPVELEHCRECTRAWSKSMAAAVRAATGAALHRVSDARMEECDNVTMRTERPHACVLGVRERSQSDRGGARRWRAAGCWRRWSAE
eukprot:3005341-Rhodomonas_salina.1